MFYLPCTKNVYLNLSVISCNKSSMLITLIHELTHAKQDKLGLRQSMSTIQKEFDADTQAALAIKCPFCMQEIIADKVKYDVIGSSCEMLIPLKLTSLKYREKFPIKNLIGGYHTIKNLLYFKKLKSMNDLCDFHKKHGSSIKRCLAKKSRDGSICDRLSTVRFD